VDVLAARFTTGQVLKATGATNAALQTWVRRGLVVGQTADGAAVDMPGQSGVRRTFSFYGLMQIAIAKSILEVSGNASQAFKAAILFAHFGDEVRSPGVPYPTGRTLLLVGTDQQCLVTSGRATGSDVKPMWINGAPQAFITVNVSAIFDRVCASLGVHPEVVIEAHTKDGDDADWDAGEIVGGEA
jgi:hypothetical protein